MMNNAAGEMPRVAPGLLCPVNWDGFLPLLWFHGERHPGIQSHTPGQPRGIMTHLMPCRRPSHSRASTMTQNIW